MVIKQQEKKNRQKLWYERWLRHHVIALYEGIYIIFLIQNSVGT